MALPKIPDSVLEELRCHCGRYLSTSPIEVNQEGRSVCGYCKSWLSSSKNSAYEAIAKLFQFPCNYKNQGCPKYMPFNIITKHEEECTFRTYQCPQNLLTPCDAVHSVAQLSEHYQQCHPELYLSSSTFAVDLTTDSEKYYLIAVDNSTYILQSKCSVEQSKLWLHVNHFRNAEDSIYIHYQIKLIDSNNRQRQRCVELEKKCVEAFTNVRLNPPQAVEVDISGITCLFKSATCIHCVFYITVSSELKHRTKKQRDLEDQATFEEKKESLKCPHCGVYMIPPIYRCDSSHITCEECRGYYDYCRSCESIKVGWTRATDLENIITKISQYCCRWLQCNKMFSCSEIRMHEQECDHRRYTCPNCNWIGIYDKILSHYQSMHPGVKICSGNTTFNLNDRYGYFIAHHEVFSFIIKEDHTTGFIPASPNTFQFDSNFKRFSFEFNYLGFPKFANDWEFVLEECRNNILSVYEKHQVAKIRNNCYGCTITTSKPTNNTPNLFSSGNYRLTVIRK